LRFFAISVLKGADPKLDPAACKQLESLSMSCKDGRSIPLLSLTALTRGSPSIRKTTSPKNASSLREALRKSHAD
jgi:hypothetical protein